MARTVKPEEYAEKRDEILDAVQRLIVTKGFAAMTIQDIQGDLGISSGKFYHYFGTKQAVLEAFVGRMNAEAENALIPLVENPGLSAIGKLRGYFAAFDQLRNERQASVAALLRVWYNDDNAVVRQKVDEAVLKCRAPFVARIVRQGVDEGAFTAVHPEMTGEVVISLAQAMASAHARLFLSYDQDRDERRCVSGIVAVHAAYLEAVERVLGASPGSLPSTDAAAVKRWLAALFPEGGVSCPS
jgi:AcrR family transcriptional regulator